MARRSYTEEEKQEALRLYVDNGPTVTGKQLGIPKETIQSWAKTAGLHTVRTQKTREATEARMVDTKAVRAALASDSLEAARGLNAVVQNRINNGLEDESLRDLATVYGILVDKHKLLTQMETDTGAQQAESMLDKLSADMKEAVIGFGNVEEADPHDSDVRP